jgi:thiol:disulfide interchange protein DsbD
LGTLYIIIGTFSSAISKLPGAGTWMESVKKFFGFVLLLMALYFLQTIISPQMTAILAAALLLAFGVFGGGLDRLTPDSSGFERFKKLLGIIAFLIGIYLLLGTMLTSGFIVPPMSKWLPVSGSMISQEENQIPWNTDLENGLRQAKVEGKPVLIDTWATWCVNCRVLEKKTFANPDVVTEAQRFYPLKIQLEKSDSPETRHFMQLFGLKQYSLPTTLLLDSQGNVQKILKGVVSPEDLITEMKKVN